MGAGSSRFFKDEADITASPQQNFDNCRPGDFKYKDQNGDNVIDENDVVKMGYDTSVPELNFSLNLGFPLQELWYERHVSGCRYVYRILRYGGCMDSIIDGANLSKEYYNNCWDRSETRFIRV